jgi:archaetidylinositol phosphate synthase
MAEFKEAKRELHGLTAAVEKRVLLWLAARTPASIGPDHLTLLGLAAMALAGIAYSRSGASPAWLHVVNLSLFLNWLGDSLDGTLARFRSRLRPRYGFYVDHMVDAYGALFVLGGLGASGLMSAPVAAALLIAYLLLHVNIYLATYTLGTFKISFGPFGGTELRILLVLLNLAVLRQPRALLLGRDLLLFDVAGFAATVGLGVTLLVSSIGNTRRLYEMERLP